MVNAIDLINKCTRLWIRDCCQLFYLCNSEKANAAILGKKE